MNFETAFNKIIFDHEGGEKITNHKNDRGGKTKWGISQKSYPNLDIAKLTIDDARAIYKRDYWDKVKGDLFPYSISFALFDQAINRGVIPSIKTAQTVTGVSVDGIIGPNTISAIQKSNAPTFVKNFLKQSEKEYHKIVANDETQGVFLEGWLNRLASIDSYLTANYLAGIYLIFFLLLTVFLKRRKIA